MSKLSKHYDSIKRKNILSIQVNLLNKCTSKCKYCRKYTWPDDTLKIERLIETIDYLRTAHSLQSITFSGGDPILYPHIVDLLEYCERVGIATSLITTLITEDVYLLASIANLATRIHVSIDGPDKQTYLETRGVDKFELVYKNLIYVNKMRASSLKKLRPIRISSTVSSINQNKVNELFRLAEETGSTINYYFIHRYDKYNPDEQKLFQSFRCINNNDTQHITNTEAILNEHFTNKTTNLKSKYCNIPYIHCLINANGDVYPCCKLLNDNGEYGEQIKYVIGNIYKDSLYTIFNKYSSKTKLIDEECGGCEERYIPYIDEVNEIINDKGDVAFL